MFCWTRPPYLPKTSTELAEDERRRNPSPPPKREVQPHKPQPEIWYADETPVEEREIGEAIQCRNLTKEQQEKSMKKFGHKWGPCNVCGEDPNACGSYSIYGDTVHPMAMCWVHSGRQGFESVAPLPRRKAAKKSGGM